VVWFAECCGNGRNAVQDAIGGAAPTRGSRPSIAAAFAGGSRTRSTEEVALPTHLHPVPPGRARRPETVVRHALADRRRSLPHWTHPEVTD
jgi:hypothetical protein